MDRFQRTEVDNRQIKFSPMAARDSGKRLRCIFPLCLSLRVLEPLECVILAKERDQDDQQAIQLVSCTNNTPIMNGSKGSLPERTLQAPKIRIVSMCVSMSCPLNPPVRRSPFM